MRYTGQTGRSFRTLFQEHLHDFKYGNGKSSFRHDIGLMEDMNTIHITGNGRLMDTLERFYIFRETKLNNQIYDKLALFH